MGLSKEYSHAKGKLNLSSPCICSFLSCEREYSLEDHFVAWGAYRIFHVLHDSKGKVGVVNQVLSRYQLH